MGHIFDFGVSQEDAQTEKKALDIKNGDSLICITSAGEVALNLLALNNIKITSVDVSENQNFLLKLKLHAIQKLDPSDAAKFLGFTKTEREKREKFYSHIANSLNEEEKYFWNLNVNAIEKGVIHAARFEKYISKFNGIALRIIGRKSLLGLFELNNFDEQKQYFESKLETKVLKSLFKFVFHPKIYKNKGLSNQAFTNSGEKNISDFFFNRFKDFCCSTIARKNYFLQLTFFNEILFQEAFPEFLTPIGISNIRKNYSNLSILNTSIFEALKDCKEREYNKFHISNIGDWVSKEDYSTLLRLIWDKADNKGLINSRYIHYLHPIPEDLKRHIISKHEQGIELLKTDRYPFYNIVPLSISKLDN